jgi:putative transposase
MAAHATTPPGCPPREIIREACAGRDASIVEPETKPGHGHRLVNVDPQHGIHRLVNQIKGRSSRLLRQEFHTLRSRRPTFQTNSYFVATVGGATLEVVESYVESQKDA